jgi:hypothetical protein
MAFSLWNKTAALRWASGVLDVEIGEGAIYTCYACDHEIGMEAGNRSTGNSREGYKTALRPRSRRWEGQVQTPSQDSRHE